MYVVLLPMIDEAGALDARGNRKHPAGARHVWVPNFGGLEEPKWGHVSDAWATRGLGAYRISYGRNATEEANYINALLAAVPGSSILSTVDKAQYDALRADLIATTIDDPTFAAKRDAVVQAERDPILAAEATERGRGG